MGVRLGPRNATGGKVMDKLNKTVDEEDKKDRIECLPERRL